MTAAEGRKKAGEILQDYAYSHLCRWIPNSFRNSYGAVDWDHIDWGQVWYQRKQAVDEFVDWNLNALSKGFNAEGWHDDLPLKYRWGGYWSVLRQATLAFYDNKCYICGLGAKEVHHVCPRE